MLQDVLEFSSLHQPTSYIDLIFNFKTESTVTTCNGPAFIILTKQTKNK